MMYASFSKSSKVLSTLSLLLAFSGLANSRALPRANANNTVSSAGLQTWWHNTGEINNKTAVQPGNVRQSHMYAVQVATDSTFYDSFVYESIPRNGNGNILDPKNPGSRTDQDDGITIESDIGLSMAWTQFLYAKDVTVKVHRLDGAKVNASVVVIRPVTLKYSLSVDDNGALDVKVPYSQNGVRFSVEFADDLYSFRNGDSGPSSGYIQSTTKGDKFYEAQFYDSNPVVGTEPLDSLLIFASPFPSPNAIASTSATSVMTIQPGLVDHSALSSTSASTIMFPPGVYYFGSTAHAILSSSISWIYLSPGAYVKGAIQFGATTSPFIRATGFGVLSGEQYVYQANPSAGYTNAKSDQTSLRMLSGISAPSTPQTFMLSGLTVANPPFNSMDFTGDLPTLSVSASDYKQVGAFFGQTDGLEMYPGSRVRDVFYHSNDDTIKAYYSNVTAERIVVWKAHTAPVVQFGWASRSMRDVLVDQIDVIHSRWNSNGSHPSIVGANQVYTVDEGASNTAVLANTIANVTFSNIRAEGISGNLFRICPLSTIKGLTIANVSIESQPVGSTGISESELPAFTDGSGKSVGVMDFRVKGFSVGGKMVSTASGNAGVGTLGDLNVAPSYLNGGGVTVV